MEFNKKGTFVVNGIDYSNGGSSVSSEVIEEEEKVVGTFFGKPMYEKTYKLPHTILSSGSFTYYFDNVNGLNYYESMWIERAFATINGDNTSTPLNYFASASSYNRINIQYNASNGWYFFCQNKYNPLTDGHFYISFRYTKKSDVAPLSVEYVEE